MAEKGYVSKIQLKNLLAKNSMWVSKTLKGKVVSYNSRGYSITELADGYLAVTYNTYGGYARREQDAITRAEKVSAATELLIANGFEFNGEGFRKERA